MHISGKNNKFNVTHSKDDPNYIEGFESLMDSKKFICLSKQIKVVNDDSDYHYALIIYRMETTMINIDVYNYGDLVIDGTTTARRG